MEESSEEEDESSEDEVIPLALGREKRSTQGNRMAALLAQHSLIPEEALFAEEEDDEDFEDSDSDSESGSSSGESAAEGEQEGEQGARSEGDSGTDKERKGRRTP
ncbi:hypothetical protein RQP46_001045 [Phenoliferia psychrophenolica]